MPIRYTVTYNAGSSFRVIALQIPSCPCNADVSPILVLQPWAEFDLDVRG